MNETDRNCTMNSSSAFSLQSPIVLVHGAWHGAWCYSRVLPKLWAAGHAAHAVTLTGVGERAHLLRPGIDLETHIADVVSFITMQEMESVVLAVHSYAGMIGTAVADRTPQRLKHLVYVDAVVPQPGESWSSTHASATREARIAAAVASGNNSFLPPDPAVFGLEAADHAWVQRRQTPHPAAPYTDPLHFDPQRVASVPRTFVDCTKPKLGTIDAIRPRVRSASFWGGAWLPNSTIVELPTGHDPMISAPDALAAILLQCAAS
jgi:pimeloyl-ACP methyl ester carboxylesterase